jgi:hypothetical protein
MRVIHLIVMVCIMAIGMPCIMARRITGKFFTRAGRPGVRYPIPRGRRLTDH